MSEKSPLPASVSIGRITIKGVSAAAARSAGPAIERALAASVVEGRIVPGNRPRLTITLPHGASERDIAAALASAVAKKPDRR